MKTMRAFRILGFFLLLLGGVSVAPETQAQPGYRVSYQTFYDELSPYGRWVRNPQYGSVWVPDVERDFQPYSTNGYWEVTEYGNTWVSDYDWGWAPFHYGRWAFDDYTGWFWVPDYEWGPAWVNWRSGGGYYGWAPLGPGMGVNVSVNIPSFWWVFVPQQYILYPRWHNYCPPRRRYTQVYNQTIIVNNYYRNNNRTYVYGPRRDEIERVTRRSVPIRTIDASPSGRGRVIVAENSRGNDRYSARRGDDRRVIDANPNSRDRGGYDNRRSDNNNRSNSRVNPYGTGSTERSSRGGGNDDAYPSTPRSSRGGDYSQPSQPERRETPNYDRNREVPGNGGAERNSRSNRSYESPSPDRGGYQSPQRSSRQEAPQYSQPQAQPQRENRGYEAPQRSSRQESAPQPQPQPQRENRTYEAPQRSSRQESAPQPQPQRENRTYEAPQRSSRQESAPAPQPRSNERSGGDNGGRSGATERSSRGPR